MEVYVIFPERIRLENLKEFLTRSEDLEKLAEMPPILENGAREIRVYYNEKGRVSYAVQDLDQEKRIIIGTKFLYADELKD